MKFRSAFLQKGGMLLLAFALMCNLLLLLDDSQAKATGFADGSGSVGDPYVISTAEQLNEVRHHLNASFVLDADIDLGASAYAAGWTPIGSSGIPFSGKFRGQGHTISGVKITGSSSYMALFSANGSSGEIADLTVRDSQVSSSGNTIAVIVGKNEGAVTNVKVIDSTVTGGAFAALVAGSNSGTLAGNQVLGGSVQGTQDTGGLLGINFGTVERNRVKGTAIIGNNEAGGLVGDNQLAGGVIRWSSYVSDSASISSTSSAGGLAGSNGGTIANSFAEGQIGIAASGTIVGGLVGLNSGTIQDSYAKGTVRGASTLGGLVGLQMNTGIIYRSYASGALTPAAGTNGAGALIGQTDGAVYDSFWNSTTAGSTGYGSGSPSGSGATGLLSAQLLKEASFATIGWNFVNNWQIVEDISTPAPVAYLEDLTLQAEGSPLPLYFYNRQYQYVLYVPYGTESVQVTAVKSIATDNVQIDSEPVNTLDKTVTLSGGQAGMAVTVSRGGSSLTYTVNVYEEPWSGLSADKTALAGAIAAANSASSSAVQGSGPGQYSTADITALSSAITAASDVYAQADASQNEVDAAVAALQAAVAAFQSSAVVVDKTALASAITAAGITLTNAFQNGGSGQYSTADMDALSSAVTTAAAVYAQADASQSETDAAAAALQAAIAQFQSAMVGTALVFAEETLIAQQPALMLTFHDPLQSVGDVSHFALSAGAASVVSAELDAQNPRKVRLLLSNSLPASGDVTVTAAAYAITLANGAHNTLPMSIHVMLAGDVLQLRQDLLAGDSGSSNGKIQISNIAAFLNNHFAGMDKHGITDKALVQFFLQQVEPLFLTTVYSTD